MLAKEIEEFAKYLEESIPLTYVGVYDDESDGGFCGITDSKKNYGYIRKPKSAKGYNHVDVSSIYGCDSENIECQLKLIVDLSKKQDKDFVHRLISKKLKESPIYCVEKIKSGDHSDSIYQQETGKKDVVWKDCDNFLLCFEFTFSCVIKDCINQNQCLDVSI